MSRLDDALREALRRVEPPEGFADRVLENLPSRDRKGASVYTPRERWWFFRAPRLRWATALATLVLVAGGAAEYRRRQALRVEQERARDQLMLALRITGSKLRLVQQKAHWME